MAHHRRLVLPLILWALALATLASLATVGSGEPPRPATDGDQPIARQTSFRWPGGPLTEPPASAGSPLQLTASDGSGLRLVELTARGVLEPPLAFTELRMAFENPEDRLREGRFRITLPSGAAISRFAMKIDGHWQEGEVVERQRARQVYEDFLHRRQDPALLEHEAGNEFSARVFPIPPRAVKELIVSYSHELPGSEDVYVIPLLGLPEIDRLDVQVQLAESPMPAGSRRSQQSNLGGNVRERRVLSLVKSSWTPNADFEIRQSEVAERQGLRHENLTLVRVAAPVETELQEIDSLYVLVDSSASRALGFEHQLALLRELLAGLSDGAGPRTPVAVAAFDQTVHPIFEGTAGELVAAGTGAVWDRLRELGALGASDPHRALRWLGEQLADDGRNTYRRVLVVSDGVATVGETEGQALRRAVGDLESHGVRRLDVLATGGSRDDELLRHLVTGNLEDDGQVIGTGAGRAYAGRDEITRRLTRASRSGIEVVVPGATWVWPRTLDAVQAGDEVLIYADLPANRPLRVELGGTDAGVAAAAVFDAEPKLLERAWIKARIDRLSRLRETDFADDVDLSRALQREATGLSIEHRVLSPYTAFLVLETEYDYQRYGLDRQARADILTVGAAGIEVLARTAPRPSTATRPEGPKVDTLAALDTDSEAEPEEPLRVATEEGLGHVEENASVIADNPRIELLRGEAERLEEELMALDMDMDMPAAAPSPAPPPAAMAPEPLRVEDRSDGLAEGIVAESPPPARSRRILIPDPTPDEPEPPPERKEPETPALSGRFAKVMELLDAGKERQALELAAAWRAESPGDVLALVALGEALEARGDLAQAARAYGSLIDLFPSRADLRRYAGERLERLADADALELAVDTYRKAVEQRPDHPSSHRLLAYALLRSGRPQEAFETLVTAVEQKYPGNRFHGVDRVLREDMGLAAAAWSRAEPRRGAEIRERLRHAGGTVEDRPSLRFVLTWETDANDVDLHVYDGKGAHAYYSDPRLPSGGELYADVTTGYGPECFTIREPERRSAYPYRLQAHYYSRGPMGYGMGMLRVVEHDGDGGLRFDQRPFVVMNDHAFVELGKVGKAR